MNEEKGTCFHRTFEIMENLQTENNIIPLYFGLMGIDSKSINICEDIFLVHGHFLNGEGEEEPHAWIEIKDQFVYETQKEEDNPVCDITEYRKNMINPKRFNLIETIIYSNSEIASRVPWNTFDDQTLASIRERVVQNAQD
jgi:hypothetical protein